MIRLDNLSFSYRKRNRAPALFTDLCLELQDGGIYGLLGKNGAGKTSLLRLMSGQLFPHGGECSVMGSNPVHRPPELLSTIFFLPEEFHVPSISGNAYRELYSPFYPNFDLRRFAELMIEFELDPAQRLSGYSYGQKKKYLLAFALSSGCRMLLLDEPTNGLDIPSKRQFRRAVAASVGEDQIILISTHQVRDMENLIDPIIVIDSGRIVFFHDLSVVSDALEVSSEPLEPRDRRVLYTEKNVAGYTVLRTVEADERAGATVDLELLFNAIISNPARIADVCSGGKNHA